MGDPTLRDEYHLAWAGADHPDGPWRHLRVVELRGEEALSRPFWFELDVVHDMAGADVDVHELVGSPVALKMFTRTEPSHRVVHGVITDAVQLELEGSHHAARYRITMRPPWMRAALMRKSIIYLEKTLRQIIEKVLERTSLGAALSKSSAVRPLTASGDLDSYRTPSLTYAWAMEDVSRLDDPTTRPYCVQYDESDIDFVARLLEEEGIAYHFEHSDEECLFVMSDFDLGRIDVSDAAPFGPNILGREVFDWRDGGRLRPRSVHLDDYDWRHPNLELAAISPAGVTDFTHIVHPGRYDEKAEHGKTLAKTREQRFDTERAFAAADGHARLLTAGTVFRAEHPMAKLSGFYLVTEVHHHGIQRNLAGEEDPGEPYRQRLQLMRCGRGARVERSNFRPARLTPRPKIYGTQTARVTADPSDPSAEINVGGPSDLGCVRVQFHWDMDEGRWREEPTSCWVRVSQFFAGANHGALWHPRVGDEVIVEFLDGDPDRPIVTGRVYNGVNPAPEDATARPTYSAIKSNTSPANGNYNLIAFEDLQGSEEIIVHAARDWNTNVERNCSRGVGLDDDLTVVGDQKIHIKGSRNLTVDVNNDVSVGVTHKCGAGTSIENKSQFIKNNATTMFTAHGGVMLACTAGAFGIYSAPLTKISASLLFMNGKSLARLTGSTIEVGGGTITVGAKGKLTLQGAPVEIKGGDITITGGTINVEGGGVVTIKGADVHLN